MFIVLQRPTERGGGSEAIVRPRSVARALNLDRASIRELEDALGRGHVYPQTMVRRTELLSVLLPIIAADDARRRMQNCGRGPA